MTASPRHGVVGLPTIHLHGALRRRFGGPFRMDVADPAEAVRALCCQLKGFQAAFREGEYWVLRGAFSRKQGVSLDESMFGLQLGGRDLHFMPVPSGAKSSGISGGLKVVVGVLAVATAFFTAGTSIAAFAGSAAAGAAITSALTGVGLSLILAGISTALTRVPKKPTNTPNSTFGGPANVATQGGPVPICYGRFGCGSTVMASSVRNDDLLSGVLTGGSGPGIGISGDFAFSAPESPIAT